MRRLKKYKYLSLHHEKTYGRRPDSSIYVAAKMLAAEATGMKTTLVDIPTDAMSPNDLETKVKYCNV